jgi:hypothetical protein
MIKAANPGKPAHETPLPVRFGTNKQKIGGL